MFAPSSMPWAISKWSKTTIVDVHGNAIVNILGSNEQSIATAAYIVETANVRFETEQ